jgi:hypothetical protein
MTEIAWNVILTSILAGFRVGSQNCMGKRSFEKTMMGILYTYSLVQRELTLDRVLRTRMKYGTILLCQKLLSGAE